MRCDKSPEEIFTAVALMSAISRMARAPTHHPPPTSQHHASTTPPAAASSPAKRHSSASSPLMSCPATTHSPGGVKATNSRTTPPYPVRPADLDQVARLTRAAPDDGLQPRQQFLQIERFD